MTYDSHLSVSFDTHIAKWGSAKGKPCNFLLTLHVFSVCNTGKQQHIESVITQIEKDHRIRIKSKEVILLDDDENNVGVARRCKMRGIVIKGDDSLDELLEQR